MDLPVIIGSMNKIESPLFREVNTERHLDRAAEVGASYIPVFLNEDALSKFQDLCHYLDYQKVDEHHEQFEEHYYVAKEVPPRVKGEIRSLSEEVRKVMAAHGGRFPVLEQWNPNDFVTQLYYQSSFIGSHRDHKVNKGLIVVFNIQGEADFEISNERYGEPIATWRVRPGDAMILRATGLNPNLQGHPGIFHSITGALTQEPRISIGLRDKR